MATRKNDIPDDDEDDLDREEGPSPEFASLLESYISDTGSEVRVGDKVSSEVIAIGQDSVYIHIGGKEDGVVERIELLDENGELACKVGDRLDLYVVHAGDGEIRLSKTIAISGNADMLIEARQNRIPVEGKVVEVCKGGFRVQVMGHIAFCPVSQMDLHYVDKPETYVGAVLEFLIERVESRGRNLVVNRRRLLERLRAEEQEKFLSRINTGDVLTGKVVRLMPFGAFVELAPGVEGMAHISELGWSRVADPSEAVTVGQSLPVKILTIEKTGSKTGGLKISLSVKQAAGDPWTSVTEKYKPGDKVTGKVTRCAPFGAFVELEPGIEGLVHISEMSYTRRVVKAEDVAKPGDTVSVTITTVDPINRRLSLSIREAEGDPWLTIANRLTAGQIVSGKVERKAEFGYFINLAPGITGLLHRSRIETAADPQAIDRLKIDDPVMVRIDALDLQERKITLAPADGTDAADWKTFSGGEKEKTSGLGSLGEKLQAAMKTRK
ncbi:MAG: 30S ribosomal protein S1 [Thermodesulfobacteriota bacterium]